MKKKYFTIILEDISDGSETGYAVTLPDLHNSVVLGENFDELAKGLQMTFESEKLPCDPGFLSGLKRQIDLIEKSRKSKGLVMTD